MKSASASGIMEKLSSTPHNFYSSGYGQYDFVQQSSNIVPKKDTAVERMEHVINKMKVAENIN